MLIDTIIKGIPIPKIYIKSVMYNGNTYRVVIDGQQRLTAILKFVKNKLKLNKPYTGEYEDCLFSDLPDEVQNEILRYKIDINEIFNPSEEEIRDLYSRVNKYTVQLNKQELRRADFPGKFIKLAEELSEIQFFEDAKIFSTKQRRRMLDVEYVEELLTILTDGVQDKKEYLDDVCEKYMEMDNADEIAEKFTGIISDIQTIFSLDIMPIRKTRFKQKSDFYSLFATIFDLQKIGSINTGCLKAIRLELQDMNEQIGPQSEDDDYREYATRCLSDANSIANRQWRISFLKSRLEACYKEEAHND